MNPGKRRKMQKREFLMKKIEENLALAETNVEKEVVEEKKEEVKVEEKPVVVPTTNKKKKVAKEETPLEETKQEP